MTDIEKLDQLNLFIAMDVQNALEAAVVTFAAMERFGRCPALFACNPANTLPFTALKALEERSLTNIAEGLHDKEKHFGSAANITVKQAIINHRDALNHPFLVKSWYPRIREFIAQKRQFKDLRPALIWTMQKAINSELKSAGFEERNTQVKVNGAMVLMLRSILDLSIKDKAEIPPTEPESRWLSNFRDHFIELLEQHPFG